MSFRSDQQSHSGLLYTAYPCAIPLVVRKYIGIDLVQGKVGKDAYVGPNGQNNPHCIFWWRHLLVVGACDVER